MVKRIVAGIKVPTVATSAELRYFVHSVFEAVGENCALAAAEIGVTPATVWKLEKHYQKDSQVIRDTLGIRKTCPRPRVWMPTNNLQRAIAVLQLHYPNIEVIVNEHSKDHIAGRAAVDLEQALGRDSLDRTKTGTGSSSPVGTGRNRS